MVDRAACSYPGPVRRAAILVVLMGCGGDAGTRTSAAWNGDEGHASAAGSDETTASSPDATGDAATTMPVATTVPVTTGDGGDSTAALDDASTGVPLDCASLGYTGLCDGDTLVWCENETIMMADCAAMGEVCGYQSDDVGYNCMPAGGGGFGFPVGDGTTYPAGGWFVEQVLGHYFNSGGFVGGHLAEDIAAGEAATANAPVLAVADGEVLYAGPNSSTYVNVVLIEHAVDGTTVCSFYGHLGSVSVASGETVTRGQQIANVLDWQAQFGVANSHLHYVLLSADLCAASDAANGALVCGYDDTPGPNGIEDLDSEPATYTSVGDVCGDHNYPDAFIAPSQFIAAHHF